MKRKPWRFKAPTKPSSGEYQRKEYPEFDHEKGRIQVPKPEKPGEKGKDGKKKEDKKEEKKDGKKEEGKKKEGEKGEKGKEEKKKEVKPSEKKTNDIIKQIEALTPILSAIPDAFGVFFGNAPIVRQATEEGRHINAVNATIEPMKKLSTAISDLSKELKNNIKKAKDKDEKEAAEKELAECHKKILKAFNDNIAENSALKPIIDKVFNKIDDAGDPTNIKLTAVQKTNYFTAAPNTPNLMQKFQDTFGELFFEANNTSPLEIKSELSAVGDIIKKNKTQLNDVFTPGNGIDPVTGPIIKEVAEKLTAIEKDIEEKKKKTLQRRSDSSINQV